MKYKFPSETKANLFISLIKAQMYDEYKNKSECLSVEFIKTGEGQLLSIARYNNKKDFDCLLYTSPSPRDRTRSRMPSSA